MMESAAQVFVIDDDAAMRDSLDFLLAAAGFAVETFESAADFLAVLPEVETGCVVTDVRMPGIDGIELLKRLKQEKASLAVVVMTGHGDVALAVEAMKAGAVDFVEKPFDDERLIETVRAALAETLRRGDAEAVASPIVARVASLSPRERQVMEGLVAGLSNKAIAREYEISPRTVEVYRANVMTKMQAANLSELVRLAVRAGVVKD
jgi:two-component system response regulator FixJ